MSSPLTEASVGEIKNKNLRTLNVAVVGSPNSGKTTLYNWLTGAHFKTVNYPGATIEYAKGPLLPALKNQFGLTNYGEVMIYDTPGVYSLFPKSADEKVTVNILAKQSEFEIDLVLLVIDSTQLNRQLLLALQMQETKIPFQIIYTMNDLSHAEGMKIQKPFIESELGQSHILNFDGLLGEGLKEIVFFLNQFKPQSYEYAAPQSSDAAVRLRINKAKDLYQKAVHLPEKINESGPLNRTLGLDRYLLHPIWGLAIFFFAMTVLFSSIYWFATPFMDWIDTGFSFLIDLTKQYIPGLFGEFLADGMLAALGGVVIFVPQIFILFLGIGVLENSGYLARVATLIDRPLAKIGLGGRSFVPLLSGFACAVPAIMATRNIRSQKEKWIVQFVIPFMTCSARLPVYGLMIAFLFGDENPLIAGLVLSLLYFTAMLVGAVISGMLAKILDSKEPSHLAMDLPLYRRPHLKVLWRQSVDKSKSFLKRAGPIIFVLAIILWFAANFPRLDETQMAEHNITNEQKVEYSYAGRLGKAIQPVFEPLGLDWRAGFGIISAFAAREVFVSAVALVYNIDGDDDDQKAQDLLTKMKDATFQSGKHQGEKIFTFSSAVGILIFFMIALQCLSTYAILKKESGGHKLALIQLVVSNLLAYGLAVAAVQGLRFFGVA